MLQPGKLQVFAAVIPSVLWLRRLQPLCPTHPREQGRAAVCAPTGFGFSSACTFRQ